MVKLCKVCDTVKPCTEFYKHQRAADKLRSECIVCYKLDTNSRYSKNPTKVNVRTNKNYHNNPEKHSKLTKSYYRKNKDKIAYDHKKWTANNYDKVREYHNKYMRDNRKSDMLYRTKGRVRITLRRGFVNNGWSKSSKTQSILGCTFEELLEYLKVGFEERYNRSIENSDVVEIDHIVPLVLATKEKHVYLLNHHTNLQWLLEEDHRIKTREDIKLRGINGKASKR